MLSLWHGPVPPPFLSQVGQVVAVILHLALATERFAYCSGMETPPASLAPRMLLDPEGSTLAVPQPGALSGVRRVGSRQRDKLLHRVQCPCPTLKFNSKRQKETALLGSGSYNNKANVMIIVLANAWLSSLLFAGHRAWHQRAEGITLELGCLGVNPAFSAQLCDLGPVTQHLCASAKQTDHNSHCLLALR